MTWRSRQNREETFWASNVKKHNVPYDDRYVLYVHKRFPITPQDHYLEIGSGPCGAHRHPNIMNIGVDPLALKYRHMGYDRFLSMIAASGELLPFRDESWGTVLCVNLLDHVDNPEKVLSEAFRVLKPEGRMWVFCDIHPTPDSMHRPIDRQWLISELAKYGRYMWLEEPYGCCTPNCYAVAAELRKK